MQNEWGHWTGPDDPELRDRVVTLTVGQLTDALAEALKVVSDAGPAWKKGDRAFVEVEVTGQQGPYTSFVLADSKHTSLTLHADSLTEIILCFPAELILRSTRPICCPLLPRNSLQP